MALLDVLFGLLDFYNWFIAGPRAVFRFFRRRMNPTAEQIAASTTPEMQRFRRNVWLVCVGWLVLSFAVACLPGSSPWIGAIALVIGLLLLPGILEKRYDRLIAARRTKDAKF